MAGPGSWTGRGDVAPSIQPLVIPARRAQLVAIGFDDNSRGSDDGRDGECTGRSR
jgi:hypothetical protein